MELATDMAMSILDASKESMKWKFCNNNLSLEELEFQINKFLTLEKCDQKK